MNDANNRSRLPASDNDESLSGRKPILHFWRCFWLTFLVLSLTYAGYCFYVPPNKINWAEGYEVAQKTALRTDKPMILSFTGEWCVPCRIMKRQVWADPEVMAQINQQFIPVAIDVDDPNNALLLERYQVQGAPVTIITDSQGNVRSWRAGRTAKPEFLRFLSEVNHSATQKS